MNGKQYEYGDFIAYGVEHGANIVNGMPWSFEFEGCPVTHETNNLYIMLMPMGETIEMKPGDMLIVYQNYFTHINDFKSTFKRAVK